MQEREITSTEKGPDGNVTAIAGPWGRRSKANALIDIQNRQYVYFVGSPGHRLEVSSVQGEEMKFLRTEADLAKPDVLASLPDL